MLTFEIDEFATGDNLYGYDFLYQIYQMACKDFTGRVTVPVLWDKQTKLCYDIPDFFHSIYAFFHLVFRSSFLFFGDWGCYDLWCAFSTNLF